MDYSEERTAFNASVYSTCQLVPYGKVTTYGHIARLINCPNNSRRVGKALKELPMPTEANELSLPYHNLNTPWQRVVGYGGIITNHRGSVRQAQKLRDEGVNVDLLHAKIDLRTFGWFPEAL